MIWKIREYLIKKLAGRQTIVLNTTIQYFGDNFNEKELELLINGHHKKFIIENVHTGSLDGNAVNYNELD